MRDLAPNIYRQRLVVEGTVTSSITAEDIVRYLKELGGETQMCVLTEPVTHQSPMYGWAGWVHWEASGAHFYAWDAPHRFFSVDIYTCKPFDADGVTQFTSDFFQATETVSREF
jgi:S-adenosylmethionine decarboxylase